MIEIIAIIFAIWLIILIFIKRKGKKYNLELAGPIIMWKTEKGKQFIEKISKKRFWKYYGNLSIIICVLAMIFTSLIILWNLYMSFKISPQRAPSPRLIIGIPGINPVIPIGYGIIALAIAIFIHEFSHGILARHGKIKVKSLGLLFLIFPIGAFVEPDEEELKKTTKIKRSRIFASGPASNIILALICLLLIAFVLAPSISPKLEGTVITTNAYGIKQWSLINEINGDQNIISKWQSIMPGSFCNLSYIYRNAKYETRILKGIYVMSTESNSPAEGKISKGAIIYAINGELLDNVKEFFDIMENTSAGEIVQISFYYNDTFYNSSIVLADKYEFIKNEEYKGKGFLGVRVVGLENIAININEFGNIYSPIKSNFLSFLALPFTGLSPPPSSLACLFTQSSCFWVIYNIIYWIFWLNFAIGTFNALPAIPLDGGYIFKDGISYIISKITRLKKDKLEKISSLLTTASSILILICIISIILIPRLRAFISF